jgi:hypothetical protein
VLTIKRIFIGFISPYIK